MPWPAAMPILEEGQGVAILEVQEARCITTARLVGRIQEIQPETLHGEAVLHIAPNDRGSRVSLGHFGGNRWRFLIRDPLNADRPLVFSSRATFYWVVPLD